MLDREKVIKGLAMCKIRYCDECPYDDENSCSFYLNHDALELLKEQEEVVHCKDCEHFEPDGVYTMCYRHNGLSPNADWFCADGKRKEGR